MKITIDANTRISQLLSVDQDLVIDTLVSLNGRFGKLRNPILRNLLAKRVTIKDACGISHTPLKDFLSSMERIGFMVAEEGVDLPEMTDRLTFIKPQVYLTLDVRPILAKDQDPLKEIMSTIRQLNDRQGLKLINTFEPLPLIHLLAEKGFAHRVDKQAPDLVITYFTRNGLPENFISTEIKEQAGNDVDRYDKALAGFTKSQISYLDVRGLQMPGPMAAILNRTPTLKKGNALFIFHKKVPVYLLPELEKQNLAYVIKTIAPGEVNVLIYWK